MLSTQLITPPAAEPVTLMQAKLHLRIDFDDDDTYITALITAAREYCERRMNRAIFEQTWVRTLDHFPLYGNVEDARSPSQRHAWPYGMWYWDKVTIRLPYPRLVSVSSITYQDTPGNTVTLPPSGYNVDVTSMPGRIAPTQGQLWPIINTYIPGSVRITYVAGSYGDGVATNTCPQSIVQAMYLLIGHWYEHRSAASALNLKNMPLAVDSLLEIHKVQILEFR